ncbi:MAG: CobW family GTP-binding protein [Rhizobiaceae bacterium]
MEQGLAEARIPIFLLTGFLGSGKTSLLNELLQGPDLSGTAVIINEFGDIGLDHHLVQTGNEDIIELSNGCLCCSIRSQLTDTLANLPLEGIQRIVIETTGLADPGPLVQSILAHPDLTMRYTIGAVITLVDALNIDRQIASNDEPALQIALADMIIVTKSDMMERESRDAEMSRIRRMLEGQNPAALIIDRNQGRKPGPELLETALNAAKSVSLKSSSRLAIHKEHEHGKSGNHHALKSVEPVSTVTLKTDTAISRRALEAFCELLASAHADAILRIKGLVAITGRDGPLVIHGVHQTYHEPVELAQWPDGGHATRIVIILRGLEPEFLERLFYGLAGVPAVDTPDEAALTENPLSVSGNFRH